MTDHTLVYLCGPPAAGKSTLMGELTRDCDTVTRSSPLVPVPYTALIHPGTGHTVAVELGKRRESFPGTDTLGMSIAPTARRWIATRPFPLILAEGDRLAISSFLQAASDAGYAVTLAYLGAPEDVLDDRCKARGSAQNETWRKGRATKAAKLAMWAEVHGHQTVRLNTGVYAPELHAASLRHQVPALAALPCYKPTGAP